MRAGTGPAADRALIAGSGAACGHFVEMMYREWRFFHSAISNIEMTLAKADFQLARQYASRTLDRSLGRRIYRMLEEE